MLKKLMSISGQAVADQKAFTWQNLIPKKANYHRQPLAAEINGPGFLAWHPDGTKIYAVAGIDGGPGVAGFHVKEDGSLEKFTTSLVRDGGGTHVAVHPSGKFLLTAQYGGGSTAFFPLNKNGELGQSVVIDHDGGSKVVGNRQNILPILTGVDFHRTVNTLLFLTLEQTISISTKSALTKLPSPNMHSRPACQEADQGTCVFLSMENLFIFSMNSHFQSQLSLMTKGLEKQRD